MNTWPEGQRHPMSQSEHEQWNRTHTPGTRQCCDQCGEFTGRCEEDSLYADTGPGPLCEDCYKETVPLSDMRIAILRNGATSEMDTVLDELTRLRAENEKLKLLLHDVVDACKVRRFWSPAGDEAAMIKAVLPDEWLQKAQEALKDA